MKHTDTNEPQLLLFLSPNRECRAESEEEEGHPLFLYSTLRTVFLKLPRLPRDGGFARVSCGKREGAGDHQQPNRLQTCGGTRGHAQQLTTQIKTLHFVIQLILPTHGRGTLLGRGRTVGFMTACSSLLTWRRQFDTPSWARQRTRLPRRRVYGTVDCCACLWP